MTSSRRDFLALTASAAAASILPPAFAQSMAPTITGTLTIDSTRPGHTLPPDFIGLSYESAQLANPNFFSASNKRLIAALRELSPNGVLRIGGGSSEFTTYSEATPSAPPPFDAFSPDTSKTVKKQTITSALALRNLRAFLDATNWRCLYGLNLGQGTKENAVAEAEAAHRILGPRLIALQISNEPDSFRNRYRPATYGPDDFIREWLDFHDAILARVPNARFGGPDISNKLPYLTAFAAEAPKHPDVVLLTGHYYAMGPAGNPGATIDNLLSPNPLLTTMKWPTVSVIEDAMRATKLPYRMTEGNSCWNGGQEGVSDVYASSLWAADTILHFATLGFSGVNMHGGGQGFYTPIAGGGADGLTRRPEFFGIQFAQSFAGKTLVATDLQCTSDRVTAYAANSPSGRPLVGIINKTASPVELILKGSVARAPWHAKELTGPSIDAKTGIRFADSTKKFTVQAPVRLAPYSAVVLSNG